MLPQPAILILAILSLSSEVAPGQQVNPDRPEIQAKDFNLTDFGGIGDGKTSNTTAFEKSIAAASAAGGGRVVVPTGVFITGPFSLRSGIELHLEKGAFVQFPTVLAAYGLSADPTARELKEFSKRLPGLISASGANDIAITGDGTIDGGGPAWWYLWATADDGSERNDGRSRPKLVVLKNCQRVRVDGVTLRNSPRWNLLLSACRNVGVEGVHVIAPADSPNTDGIDPDGCERVVIQNCDLDVGDDDVAIKAVDRAADNIVVENCHCLHGRGISIGSETYKGIHDVIVRDCTFTGTAHGIHIKSARDRGNQLYGFSFSNLSMTDVPMPLSINMYYMDKLAQATRRKKAVTPSTPFLNDVRIDGLTATGADDAGEIIGLPESPVKAITLTDVKISSRRGIVVTDASGVVFKNVRIDVRDGEKIIATDADVDQAK